MATDQGGLIINTRAGGHIRHQKAERTFALSATDFSVTRQLTYELSNVAQDELQGIGWTADTEHFLKNLMYSVSRELEEPKQVQLTIREIDNHTAAELNAKRRAAEQSDPEAPIIRTIPDIVNIWLTALRIVWRHLGPLEGRYRTGYDEHEIESALAAVEVMAH
ncbi:MULTISPECIES: hypothetical protein [Nocardia]|uniref:hypothetical protein n=1 Tax=Nocardia TaxID=1817 RepID=UPI0007E93908|nr:MULTISPECIES: hypothetical protein [Nocardia]MBF6278615.1 hypothetical protein [Nocardia nova]OBA51766.1 hypothetical protein A5789_27150 [Nocardia sp. 852002-51101_SCH5132738]OBB54156.1 hypothetical protein A5748_12850 [Nocardia sp. 852002-51244_SCH5132740]OBF85239.1 hypothetical protein A9X06_13615 [Mycobacterium sp. 852002-51759_SCH5129042]